MRRNEIKWEVEGKRRWMAVISELWHYRLLNHISIPSINGLEFSGSPSSVQCGNS